MGDIVWIYLLVYLFLTVQIENESFISHIIIFVVHCRSLGEKVHTTNLLHPVTQSAVHEVTLLREFLISLLCINDSDIMCVVYT